MSDGVFVGLPVGGLDYCKVGCDEDRRVKLLAGWLITWLCGWLECWMV